MSPLVAALATLAYRNIPIDVQDLLIQGDPSRGIPPGVLEEALDAAADAAEEAERLANTCDEPGCDREASQGFPLPGGGYRRTCHIHGPTR